jgi:hypothetical protein
VELLDGLLNYVSCCLHEEVFSVVDKLLAITRGALHERILVKLIEVMLDKYTMRTKAQKLSIQTFTKSLLDAQIPPESFDDQLAEFKTNGKSFIEIVFQVCVVANDDSPAKIACQVLQQPPSKQRIDDSVIASNRLH